MSSQPASPTGDGVGVLVVSHQPDGLVVGPRRDQVSERVPRDAVDRPFVLLAAFERHARWRHHVVVSETNLAFERADGRCVVSINARCVLLDQNIMTLVIIWPVSLLQFTRFVIWPVHRNVDCNVG